MTAGAPLFFLLGHPSNAPVPVWSIFWNLFGASNQLLAALTLLGVTIWLWRTQHAWWVWLVTGVPTVFMYVMSTWAILPMTAPKFRGSDGRFVTPTDPVPWIGLVLIALAAMMLIEAIRIILSLRTPPAAKLEVPAAAAS